MLRIFAASL